MSAAELGERFEMLGELGAGGTGGVYRVLDEVRAGELAVVLHGRGDDREQVPFRAIDRVVDDLSSYLMGLPDGEAAALIPEDVAALSRLFPALVRVPAIEAAVLPGSGPTGWDEVVRRGFANLLELLRRLGARRAVITAIDDAHDGTIEGARMVRTFAGPTTPLMLSIMVHHGGDGEVAREVLREVEQWPGDLRRIEIFGASPS